MRTYEFVIGPAEAGLRLDHYLVRRLPETMSRNMIQRGVSQGRVQVNDRPAKAHAKLHLGDVINAVFPELGSQGGSVTLTPQEIPIEIVYEDEWLLVVNKPAGLVTHPAPGHWDGTLVNALIWHLKHKTLDQGQKTADTHRGHKTQDIRHKLESEVSSLESDLPRAGIVHRLDKDTSGLLLVAKTEESHIALSRQLKARTIHRRYLALVEGHVALDRGTLDAPIGRHAKHRKMMTVSHLGGRSAVTHYQVIKRLGKGRGQGEKEIPFLCTLLDVSLDTGRTHQIRVHMAHAGHPVVGDLTYGNHPQSYWTPLGVERQFLHAMGLTFEHPVSKKPVVLAAPVPPEMAAWLSPEVIEKLSRASALAHQYGKR